MCPIYLQIVPNPLTEIAFKKQVDSILIKPPWTKAHNVYHLLPSNAFFAANLWPVFILSLRSNHAKNLCFINYTGRFPNPFKGRHYCYFCKQVLIVSGCSEELTPTILPNIICYR
jgi:hypothetical protein